MRSRCLALFAVLLFAAALACAPTPEEDGGAMTDATAGEGEAGEAAGAGEDAGMAAGEEDHHAADMADERAEYSKPQEVYDFVGIEAGDTVLDIRAAGGYNTILLAERVGAEGNVVAHLTSPAFKERLAEGGDLAHLGNVELHDTFEEIPDASVDHAVAIRAYHLFNPVDANVAEVFRILKPGATVGVVEVRLNQEEGHEMSTHRLGEQTVIQDWEGGGFEFVESSDILRREGDDYTAMTPTGPDGSLPRYMTDRMLMLFRKPAE